jgi:hypothetical protein
MKKIIGWVSANGVGFVFLFFVYLMASGAGFGGFYAKYGFHDLTDAVPDTQRFTFEKMVDETAYRPAVYRQLLPMIARGVESLIPQQERIEVNKKIIEKIKANRSASHVFYQGSALSENLVLEYLVVYALSFISLFVALFLMRSVCIELIEDRVAATLAPVAFAITLPLLLSKSGYFYDFPEIAFMAAGMWCAIRRRWLLFYLVTAVATVNKETYFLYAISLFPFFYSGKWKWSDFANASGLIVVGALINAYVKYRYRFNPGVVAEFHLWENLRFYLNPMSYVRFAINDGVITPNEFNIVNIFMVAWLIRSGWKFLGCGVKWHILLCAAINFPLFFLFCAPEELRNLSMLYMALVLLISINVREWIRRDPVARGNDLPHTPLNASLPSRDREREIQ